MKKLLLVAAIAVFGITNVKAQEIEFGAKVGVNLSDIYGDNTGLFDPITSIFNVGIMAEMSFSEKFSFQPEIMFSPQGTSIGDDIISLGYLNVPLMAKYYVTKGLSIEAGPQIGFLLYGDNEGRNVKDDFNTVDFGVNFGLGYKLNNGLNFGARYDLGLTNINGIEGSSDSYKNGVFQVSVGYFFFKTKSKSKQ
ncbi:porin family protein [Bizionia arctica]|nr:porin family protein [Bizionia arctica]